MDILQKQNAAWYDQKAEWWATEKDTPFFHEKGLRALLPFLKKGGKILEIGCAHGSAVPMFLGFGNKVSYEGFDISKKLLAIAKRRYPNLVFHQGDISDNKGLPKKKYDGFFAGSVLMHIQEEKWPKMLENIESIMKPGAFGYIRIPMRRLQEHAAGDNRHFEFWEREKAQSFFETRGWKVRKYVSEPSKHFIWQWFIVELPHLVAKS